jgi:hypothetical protein
MGGSSEGLAGARNTDLANPVILSQIDITVKMKIIARV